MAPPAAAGATSAAPPEEDMAGRYCIVTGCNGGIGYQVARGLMARGAHVVMACRNRGACEAAAEGLRAEGLRGTCACRSLDLTVTMWCMPGCWTGGPGPARPRPGRARSRDPLSSASPIPQDLDSVRAFAAQQRAELARAEPGAGAGADAAGAGGGAGRGRALDVLVNNAGVMGVPRPPGSPEPHLAANHTGPYLLTRLLLPALAPGSGRVVTVASRAHFWGGLRLRGGAGAGAGAGAAPEVEDDTHNWFFQYARSKLCNVLFTAELQRRHGHAAAARAAAGTAAGEAAGGSGPGLREAAAPPAKGASPLGLGCYAVSPGFVDTGIFRHLLPSWAQWLRAPLRPLVRSPEQGARVVVWAACSSSLQGRDALFLHDCREMQASPAARDPRLAAELWRASAALTGLPEEEEGEGEGAARGVRTESTSGGGKGTR
ncbi:hypothetical protein HYH03_019017 [Edaphochlamys debaryana]|uniref:Uncharacterized protein n=1 Tax=Edaphochlamys debaryana TaxID=47281 RepID=A0A835XDK2_9CHLO|nr:hypothetical protein HYH03_019017 [Edaphochlamys debaryana]|eukprot:KAG2482028.1 hypothetical protein HYH03_019017 [Edaphochlamys debaryana]